MLVHQKSSVLTNYFPLISRTPFFKYKINVTPEIPINQLRLLYKILSQLKQELSQHLNLYQPLNFNIYSPTQCEEFTLQTTYENIDYTLVIGPPNLIELSQDKTESSAFFGRFMKILQSTIKLKPVGRKYFDDQRAKEFPNWKLSVLPGYQTSLKFCKQQVIIKIDSCFKVIRQETVYDYLEGLMQKYKGDQDRVKDEVIGRIIMTK